MAFADIVGRRTAYAAAPEPVAGEDAFLAFHHEMNRMLDKASSGFGFGFRFGALEFPSLPSAWSPAEVRVRHIAIFKSRHG